MLFFYYTRCLYSLHNKGKQTVSALFFQIEGDRTAVVSYHYTTDAPIVSPLLSPEVFVLIKDCIVSANL